LVWLRYELFRGKLTPIQFQLSEQKLKEFIKARGNTKPLQNLIDQIIEKRADLFSRRWKQVSAFGQKRTLKQVRLMSALPPKADIR
jgi:hypothetical protein